MTWVVEVLEPRVYTYGGGTPDSANWWTAFRQTYDRVGRIADYDPVLVGSRAEVACDSKDDAAWLAEHMVSHGGLHPKAVRVKQATTNAGPPAGQDQP